MSDLYMRELLRVAVAQICQTIGYHATQQAPLELLQDTLHKFLQECARDLRRQVEHYNRTEANLDDALLTLNSVSINVSELLDYVNNVESVPCNIDVPKFPTPKQNNLNFLKPGSKEVLTRPVHIYEHLPPMLPPDATAITTASLPGTPHYVLNGSDTDKQSTALLMYNYNSSAARDDVKPQKLSAKVELTGKRASESKDTIAAGCLMSAGSTVVHGGVLLDEEGRPTREISSVVMTTGGFISPAIEGKLPDAIIPDLIEKLQGYDALPPQKQPPPPLLYITPCPPTTVSVADSQQAGKSAISLQAGNLNKLGTSELAQPSTTNATATAVTTAKASTASSSETVHPNDNSTMLGDNAVTALPAQAISSKKQLPPHSAQPPTLASKLLKKAKKKSTPQSAFAVAKSGAPVAVDVNMEKAQRKNRRTMQKLMKTGIADLKQMTDIPAPQRLQFEKYLKKQAKQKHKLLKHANEAGTNQPAYMNSLSHIPKVVPQQGDATTSRCASLAPKDLKLPQPAAKEAAISFTTTETSHAVQQQKMAPFLDGSLLASRNVCTPNDMKNDKLVGAVDADSAHAKTLLEIKLSNEPDRSKLNIFKKISKQKLSKPLSPNRLLSTQLYSASAGQNPLINLPSGTTITPTPASLPRHIYPPVGGSISGLDNIPEKTASSDMDAAHDLSFASNPMGNQSLAGLSALTEQDTQGSDAINKPKKRGRKPGSKNHPKTPFKANPAETSATETAPTKKPKKLKSGKFMPCFPNMNQDSWNLMNYKHQPFGAVGTPEFNTPWSGAPTPFTLQSILQPRTPTQMKQMKGTRKERKKMKLKNSPPNAATATVSSVSPPPLEQQLSSPKLGLSVPTNEEVNTINKKLMRMDTVLKPAPPLVPFGTAIGAGVPSTPQFMKRLPEHCEDAPMPMHSPTKSSTPTKSPGSKKRAQQRQQQLQQQQTGVDLRPKFLPNVFMSAQSPGFQNLSAILKLCPFTPRPGLIPAGLIPNSLSNAATQNMFLPRFLSFPNIKTSPVGANTQELNNSGKSEKFPESLGHPSGERNYCNVAPLVPESMKLTPPDAKPDRSFNDRDYPRTPKVRQSPTLSDLSDEILLKKLDNISTPDSTVPSSRSVPVTPGGVSLDSLTQLVGDKHANSSVVTPTLSEKSNFLGNMFGHSPLLMSHKYPNMLQSPAVPATPMAVTPVNADDPIEVSDDSVDSAPTRTLTSSPNVTTPAQISKARLTQSLLKSTTPGTMHMNDIFKANNSSASSSIKFPANMVMDLNPKDGGKKLKKASKFAKSSKNPFTSPTSSTYNLASLDMFGAEKGGVSKLAGGADLIPLASTGLAYSAKTIPVTSLTGAMTPQIVMQKKDFAAPSMLDNVATVGLGTDIGHSVTVGNIDTQKKKKEHKKLKKLKEEKIKRKKDKKDKSKSKERYEKYLHKNDKLFKDRTFKDTAHLDKDMLRKLKKERKKKHKQIIDDAFENHYETSTIGATDKLAESFSMSATNVSSITSPTSFAATSFTANCTSTTLVPKLTLKLGSSQSPTPLDDALQQYMPHSSLNTATERTKKREPSPELARISPLVTRPPKQKSSASDAASTTATSLNVSATATGVAAAGSNLESSGDSSSKASLLPSTSAAHSLVPPSSPWLSGVTLAASSVLLPQQLLQSAKAQEHTAGAAPASHKSDGSAGSGTATAGGTTATAQRSNAAAEEHQSPVSLITDTSRPSSYIDAEGNRVWICPACGKVDDGSPMIGCDGCDAWYHWVCVGISVAPKDNEDWFCRVCITRKRGVHGGDKKRKRSKKK